MRIIASKRKTNFLFLIYHFKQEPHRRRNLSICPWLTFQDLLNEILSLYVYNKLDEILPVSEELLEQKKKNQIDDNRCEKTFSLLLSQLHSYLLNLNSDRKREFGTKTFSDLTIPRTTILLPKRNCLTRACNSKVMPRPSSINPLKSIESASRIQLDYRPSCNSLPFDQTKQFACTYKGRIVDY